MYKLLSVLALYFIAVSCGGGDNPKPPPDCCGPPVRSNVLITYVNNKGEDLLNPHHDHAITKQNTTLYDLVNGKKIKASEDTHSFSARFMIIDNFDTTHVYGMVLYANFLKDRDTATTYIAFKDYPTDTLKVQYKKSGSTSSPAKVWYNQQLKSSSSQKEPIHFQITKQLEKK